MSLLRNPKSVLVLGGGDGCAVREILKYKSVESIILVDLDPEMTALGKDHPVFKDITKGALSNSKVKIYNQDAFLFLEKNKGFYDLIIADFPDPKSPELSRLYSKEFYSLIKHHMRPSSLFITQAGSPYYATKSFYSIEKTLRAANFYTLPLHNQVLTLGEWGWVLASPTEKNLREKLLKQPISVSTKWITNSSFNLISSFGKPLNDTTNLQVNTILNPVLYRYYLDGNWDLY